MSLCRTLVDLGLTKGSDAFLGVGDAVIRYALGVDTAYACQRKLQQHFDFSLAGTSAMQFRLYIADVSYIHLNLKYFCFNIVRRGLSDAKLSKYAQIFGIDRNDAVLLKRVLWSRKVRRELRDSKRFQDLSLNQLDLNAFNQVFVSFNQMYDPLMKYIRHLVFRKLRFISTSSNMSFEDFHMELMCKAVQTYVRLVPTEMTLLHVQNYIKRSLANTTTNIIKSYTSQKRQCMVQGAADGFGGHNYEIPVMSENQLMRAFGVENVSYETMVSTEASHDEMQKHESDISFYMLKKRFGTTQKRRRLLSLLAQEDDEDFNQHLIAKRKIKPNQDLLDFEEKVGKEGYIQEVCRFLNLAENRVYNFIRHIAQVAYPERSAV